MRVKRIELSFEYLLELLHGSNGDYESNLPEDAEVVAVKPHEYSFDKFYVYLRSREWEDVLEGDIVPIFEFEMKDVTDYYKNWSKDNI